MGEKEAILYLETQNLRLRDSSRISRRFLFRKLIPHSALSRTVPYCIIRTITKTQFDRGVQDNIIADSGPLHHDFPPSKRAGKSAEIPVHRLGRSCERSPEPGKLRDWVLPERQEDCRWTLSHLDTSV